jgi:hypothetical protein
MIKRLSYKNKIIFLGVAAILLFILIYQMAIAETLAAYSKLKMSENQLVMIEKAPEEIASIKAKLDKFATSVGGSMDTVYRNEPLLEFLSDVCKKNQTVLADYLSPHVFNQDDFVIETKTAVIEGRFLNLISTMHEVERNYLHGKTISASFQLKEDLKSGQRRLYLTLLIQSVINQHDSNAKQKI